MDDEIRLKNNTLTDIFSNFLFQSENEDLGKKSETRKV